MTESQTFLFQQVDQLQIVPQGYPLSFAQKVAKENGWDLSHAIAADREYRRFLLLTLVADHVVCPSEDVDAVWHLHMIYTRSYWEDFCQDIAGRAVHHQPSYGGADETQKYREFYQRTLTTYQEIFGEAPRDDIWPGVDTRFGHSIANVRINQNDFFLIRKPKWWKRLFPGSFRFASLGKGNFIESQVPARDGFSSQTTFENECAEPRQRHDASPIRSTFPLPVLVVPATSLPLAQLNPLQMQGPTFLKLFLVLVIITIIAAWILRKLLDPPADQSKIHRLTSENRLSIYDLAFLQGGALNVANVALVRLLDSGALEPNIVTRNYDAKLKRGTLDDSDVFGRTLLHAAQTGSLKPSQVVKQLSYETAQLEKRLAGNGLIETFSSLLMRRIVTACLFAPVVLLGISKVAVGVSRDRPVGFLIVLLILAVVSWLLFSLYSTASSTGRLILKQTQDKHNDLKARGKLSSVQANKPEAAKSKESELLGDAALPMALFGAVAMTDLGLHSDSMALMKLNGAADAGSGFAGTGCGGDAGTSGCGSGCGGGGCGGCGG